MEDALAYGLLKNLEGCKQTNKTVMYTNQQSRVKATAKGQTQGQLSAGQFQLSIRFDISLLLTLNN